MLLELDPPRGVGPIRFGMTVDEGRAALTTLGSPYWMCLGGRHTVSRDSGLSITPHTCDGRVDSVWFEGPPDPGSEDAVTFRGINLFAAPYQRVVAALREHVALVEEDHSFIAPDLQLTLVLSWDDPDLDAFERIVLSVPEVRPR